MLRESQKQFAISQKKFHYS